MIPKLLYFLACRYILLFSHALNLKSHPQFEVLLLPISARSMEFHESTQLHGLMRIFVLCGSKDLSERLFCRHVVSFVAFAMLSLSFLTLQLLVAVFVTLIPAGIIAMKTTQATAKGLQLLFADFSAVLFSTAFSMTQCFQSCCGQFSDIHLYNKVLTGGITCD